jgi:hypothetical protein
MNNICKTYDDCHIIIGHTYYYSDENSSVYAGIAKQIDGGKVLLNSVLWIRSTSLFGFQINLTRYLDSLIFKINSESDLLLIRFSLEKQYYKTKCDCETLRIINERKLTDREIRSLPVLLQGLNYDELKNELYRWESLLSDYENLLKKIEEVLKNHAI